MLLLLLCCSCCTKGILPINTKGILHILGVGGNQEDPLARGLASEPFCGSSSKSCWQLFPLRKGFYRKLFLGGTILCFHGALSYQRATPSSRPDPHTNICTHTHIYYLFFLFTERLPCSFMTSAIIYTIDLSFCFFDLSFFTICVQHLLFSRPPLP